MFYFSIVYNEDGKGYNPLVIFVDEESREGFMIQLYIGEGKGKTTAAVGQALRAWGWGKRVLFSQFLKSGESGEILALEDLDNIEIFRPEMRHKGFIWNMDEKALSETQVDLQKGFRQIREIAVRSPFFMIVMDEILDAVQCGFISEDWLLDFVLSPYDGTEYILTGRNASDRLRGCAHYITNMTKEKHPYDLGISARKGIEY